MKLTVKLKQTKPIKKRWRGCIPLPVMEYLRSRGHDVLTVLETGKANMAMPDEEILKFATKENRAVLTLNRLHFIRLHREQPQHSGIIVCKMDSDFAGQAERIHQALDAQDSISGKLIRVNRPQK